MAAPGLKEAFEASNTVSADGSLVGGYRARCMSNLAVSVLAGAFRHRDNRWTCRRAGRHSGQQEDEGRELLPKLPISSIQGLAVHTTRMHLRRRCGSWVVPISARVNDTGTFDGY